MIVTRCSLWAIVGIGTLGPSFFVNPEASQKFSSLFMLLFIFYAGNWVITKLERTLSYAVRRSVSSFITLVCLALIVYLFHAHTRYFGYTMSFYYVGASLCLMCLVTDVYRPLYLYKMHDSIISHFLFLILYVLSIIQLGVLQTWLLYHNALDAGVAIEDILVYAKRKKDGHVDEAAVIELRNQIMEQEKIIKYLTDLHVQGGDAASTERTGLLAASAAPGKAYGSSTIGDTVPMNIAAVPIQPTRTTSVPEEATTTTMPKSAMKQESAIKTSTSESVSGLSTMLKEDTGQTKGSKTGPISSTDLTLDTKPSDGTFVFKQPNAPPPR